MITGRRSPRGRRAPGGRASDHTEIRRQALLDLAAWIRRDRVWIWGLGGLGLTVLPLLGGELLTGAAARLLYLLPAIYGLYLLAVLTGQPSLGQAGFIGVGAFTTAAARGGLGIDGFTTMLLTTLFTGLVGLAVGRATARLSPAVLGLATWAFGWLLTLTAAAFPDRSGGVGGLALNGPLRFRSAWLGVDVSFGAGGHLLLGMVVATLLLLLLRSAQRSGLGRAWAALRSGPAMAESLGINVTFERTRAFAVAAALAGLSGCLLTQENGLVDPTLYNPMASVLLLVAVQVGSRVGFAGPLLGLALIRGVPAAILGLVGWLGRPGTGLGGVTEALAAAGALALTGTRATWAPRRRLRLRSSAGEAITVPVPTPAPDAPRGLADRTRTLKARTNTGVLTGAADALRVEDVAIRFGGVLALAGVDLNLAPGTIHGLIGPNGSGKSTLLRCIAGTLTPERGQIHLGLRNLTGKPEDLRARAGIVRTFQRTVVMDGLTVREHVLAGLDGPSRTRAAVVRAILRTPRHRSAALVAERQADQLLGVFGLENWANRPPRELSGGRRRLLHLAAALATRPAVMLLDEPAAGMTPDELWLLERGLGLIASAGVTVLVVEHNIGFLTRSVSELHVLAEGRLIAAGPPDEVVNDPAVIAAYLGQSRPGGARGPHEQRDIH